MPNMPLSPHEMLCLHEILSLKNTCALKSSLLQAIISDQQLKDLSNTEMTNTKRQIQELQSLLSDKQTQN